MDDIDASDAKPYACTASSPPMKAKSAASKTGSARRQPTQLPRTRARGGNVICLYCDRCGGPFYTNSNRSPLCGICLRALRALRASQT
jgi:hypothetical protein